MTRCVVIPVDVLKDAIGAQGRVLAFRYEPESEAVRIVLGVGCEEEFVAHKIEVSRKCDSVCALSTGCSADLAFNSTTTRPLTTKSARNPHSSFTSS